MKNLVCTTENGDGVIEVTLNRLEKDGDLTPLKKTTYVCDQMYIRKQKTTYWGANYIWVNVPIERRERKAHARLLTWWLQNVS